jgi:hypothetical protein
VIVRGLIRIQPDMLVEPKVLTTTKLKSNKL